jgi:hypothetical protein
MFFPIYVDLSPGAIPRQVEEGKMKKWEYIVLKRFYNHYTWFTITHFSPGGVERLKYLEQGEATSGKRATKEEFEEEYRQTIAELGADGWEMTGVVSYALPSAHAFSEIVTYVEHYFKRPLPAPRRSRSKKTASTKKGSNKPKEK